MCARRVILPSLHTLLIACRACTGFDVAAFLQRVPLNFVALGSTGPDGSLFKGVVVHFNGHFPVPLSTLRELLVSRGGVVEAYNTSRCTHMICEVLPAAKIRELRKVYISSCVGAEVTCKNICTERGIARFLMFASTECYTCHPLPSIPPLARLICLVCV